MRVIDVHTHCQADDPNMDEYVRFMDDAGVTAALVHAVESRTPFPVRGNDAVLNAVQRHPGRLYGSVYVDFRDPIEKTIRTIERYHGEGFVSIKMFPNFGYDPNDEAYEPIWRVVESLGMMCLSHCGWLAPFPDGRRVHSLTATPFHFEVPARRHPGIHFIFGHFGGAATYLETLVLTSRLKNCFGDVTPGWGRWVFEQRMPGLAALDYRQVLYGTDNAGKRYARDIAWWRQTLKDMGRTDQEIEQFFFGNAARLLGLAGEAPADAR